MQLSNEKHSPEAKYIRSITSNTQKWDAHVSTFTLDVDWETLADRPKNSAKDKAAGEKVMKEMADWPVDACSGHWTDRNGRLLLAYFANHIEQVSSTCLCLRCYADFIQPQIWQCIIFFHFFSYMSPHSPLHIKQDLKDH